MPETDLDRTPTADLIQRADPPADLAPFVEAFAGRRALVARTKFPVFPTARAELIFHFADPFLVADASSAPMCALAPAALLGPRMAVYWQAAGPRIEWFMVQLTARGCEELLGVRFAGVWGRAIDATDLLWEGLQLHARLQSVKSFEERMAAAVADLRRRLTFRDRPDSLTRAVSLARAGRIRSVDALCSHLDVGSRRLHQRFAEAYGVGPKSFLSLMRFGRQLESKHPLAPQAHGEIALEYHDQSHAIREFRRFSGMNPSAYARLKANGDRLIYTGAQVHLTEH